MVSLAVRYMGKEAAPLKMLSEKKKITASDYPQGRFMKQT